MVQAIQRPQRIPQHILLRGELAIQLVSLQRLRLILASLLASLRQQHGLHLGPRSGELVAVQVIQRQRRTKLVGRRLQHIQRHILLLGKLVAQLIVQPRPRLIQASLLAIQLVVQQQLRLILVSQHLRVQLQLGLRAGLRIGIQVEVLHIVQLQLGPHTIILASQQLQLGLQDGLQLIIQVRQRLTRQRLLIRHIITQANRLLQNGLQVGYHILIQVSQHHIRLRLRGLQDGLQHGQLVRLLQRLILQHGQRLSRHRY